MSTDQELKNNSSLHKEFKSLLDQDFKDRKLKENEIIKATVTEITKSFIICDLKAKQEAMIPIEIFACGNCGKVPDKMMPNNDS